MLSASLVVRDDAGRLAACLESLRGHVDEIVVYDAGSTDGSATVASQAGARVVAGHWDGDEARARTAALQACRGTWVLVLDADERIAGEPAGLRTWLAARDCGTCTVETHVLDAGGGYAQRQPRLLRRDGTVWTGRAHARPSNDLTPDEDDAPGRVLRVLRDETADPDAALARAEHGAAAGLVDVARLQQGDDADALALALLDLGTDLLLLDRRAHAMQALLIVRRLLDFGPVWAEATDRLARLARDAGHHALALTLDAELRRAGGTGYEDQRILAS